MCSSISTAMFSFLLDYRSTVSSVNSSRTKSGATSKMSPSLKCSLAVVKVAVRSPSLSMDAMASWTRTGSNFRSNRTVCACRPSGGQSQGLAGGRGPASDVKCQRR